MHNYYNDLKYQVKFYYNLTKTAMSDSYKYYIESDLFKVFEYLEDSYYEFFYGPYDPYDPYDPYAPYQPGIKGYKSLQKIAHKAALFSISKDAINFKLLLKNPAIDDNQDIPNTTSIIACFGEKYHIDFNLPNIELKNLVIWQVLMTSANSSAICRKEFFDKVMNEVNTKEDYIKGINQELEIYFRKYDIESVSEFENLINDYCPSKSDLTNGIATEKDIICIIFQDFPTILTYNE